MGQRQRTKEFYSEIYWEPGNYLVPSTPGHIFQDPKIIQYSAGNLPLLSKVPFYTPYRMFFVPNTSLVLLQKDHQMSLPQLNESLFIYFSFALSTNIMESIYKES